MITKKAQSSVEYLALLGFLLLITFIFFMQANREIGQKIVDTTAINAVEKIAATVDEVYRLGPGTKLYVSVDIPPNVEGSIAEQHEVGLQVRVPDAGITDVIKIVDGTVIGAIPLRQGQAMITVEMLDSGVIIIGCGLAASPSSIIRTMSPGDSETITINVTNACTKEFMGIASSASGSISSWMSLTQPLSSLAPEQNSQFDATITVPGLQAPGTYSAYIIISGSDAYFEIPVTITVPDLTIPTAYNGAPTGTTNDPSPQLSVYSGEAATCKGSIGADEPYSSMDFTFSGTGVYHTYQTNAMADGLKTVYVRCRDSTGNTMASSYSWSFTVNASSGGGGNPPDPTGPITVTLVSPADGATLTIGQDNFQYIVTHSASMVFSCELLIKSGLVEAGYGTGGANNNTVETIAANSSITSGSYQWRVNCTNGYVWGVSSYRSFTQSNTASTTIFPTKDTYILGGSTRNQNYGVSLTLLTKSSSGGNTLIYSDVTGIPSGATITSATLYMNLYSASGGPYTHVVNRLTQSWLEGTDNGATATNGASWDKYDGVNNWATSGGDHDGVAWATTSVTSAAGWKTWDITTLVQALVDGTYPNNGLIIRNTNTGSSTLSFRSSEYGTNAPYIAISYTY